MKDLLVWLTTWRRPDLLARSLPTLRAALDGCDADVHLNINEADPETLQIYRGHWWIKDSVIYPGNEGLIRPWVAQGLPQLSRYRYVLFTEDDVGHVVPKRDYVALADAYPGLGGVSGFASSRPGPRFTHGGRDWDLSGRCETVDLMIRTDLLREMGPWPVDILIALDDWLVQQSPKCLNHIGRPVAVCDGCEHWGAGRSTWTHDPQAFLRP